MTEQKIVVYHIHKFPYANYVSKFFIIGEPSCDEKAFSNKYFDILHEQIISYENSGVKTAKAGHKMEKREDNCTLPLKLNTTKRKLALHLLILKALLLLVTKQLNSKHIEIDM